MAEDADQLRQAIAQTREDLGQTVQVLGEKADVKAQVSRRVDDGRNKVRSAAGQARATATTLADKAEEALPEGARPVAGQARRATTGAAGRARQSPAPLLVAAGVVLVLLVAQHRRHRRRVGP